MLQIGCDWQIRVEGFRAREQINAARLARSIAEHLHPDTRVLL